MQSTKYGEHVGISPVNQISLFGFYSGCVVCRESVWQTGGETPSIDTTPAAADCRLSGSGRSVCINRSGLVTLTLYSHLY